MLRRWRRVRRVVGATMLATMAACATIGDGAEQSIWGDACASIFIRNGSSEIMKVFAGGRRIATIPPMDTTDEDLCGINRLGGVVVRSFGGRVEFEVERQGQTMIAADDVLELHVGESRATSYWMNED